MAVFSVRGPKNIPCGAITGPASRPANPTPGVSQHFSGPGPEVDGGVSYHLSRSFRNTLIPIFPYGVYVSVLSGGAFLNRIPIPP